MCHHRSGEAHYARSLEARGGGKDNHATSGLKFKVLIDFLTVGCSVLLSDVDVLWLQNPFTLPSLYRDADVEGMTDGWDDPTAYGYRWLSQQGPMLRLSARNSGLFYVKATRETLAMMARLKGSRGAQIATVPHAHAYECTLHSLAIRRAAKRTSDDLAC